MSEPRRREGGLVLWGSQGGFHVETREGVWFCQVRGKLFKAEARETTPVAVGDVVTIERNARDEAGTGIIVERAPRRTVLSRRTVGRAEVEQVIAANVDQLVIVVSADDPPLRERLVDRYIVAAHKGRLAPLLCVTKIDLADPEAVYERIRVYERLGYPIVVTSITLPYGLDDLRRALADKTSVLSGPSGSGKSSLLNALEPSLALRVGEVSRRTKKGGHTTTSARIYTLPGGARVVDTPGLRELQVWDVLPEEAAAYFVELAPYASSCRFRSCCHREEPDCAVRAAVERGEIAATRYDSYLRLFDTVGDTSRR